MGLGGHYVGGLNFPTAIVASEDLRYWYKLYLNGSGYSHFVEVAAQGGKLFAAMGSELLVFALEDVEAAFAGEPFLRPYGAHFDRVRGALFLLRRPARSEGQDLPRARGSARALGLRVQSLGAQRVGAEDRSRQARYANLHERLRGGEVSSCRRGRGVP